MKPSWDDAPKDAKWLAQDYNGEWWWFVNEPFSCEASEHWDSEKNCGVQATGRINPDWKETLEKRP